MKDTIGVGLIGTGYMGKCHALAWGAVRAVFGEGRRPIPVHLGERETELAKRRADELGFARASGDWRAVIADPDVEVVSITTPNAFHAEMAVAALEAGKHVWCEKPMATSVADAERMRDAARRSGRVAVLGYNYIQNPAIRQIGRLIADGAIGAVSHVRIEMDEDFMADPDAPFGWKSEAASGVGAPDDFGVHPLSLLHVLVGLPVKVMTHLAKPFVDRPLPGGGKRVVETFDVAGILFETANGAAGTMSLSRSAWGRKGRISLQVFGAKGAILFDQERMNEFQLYSAADPLETQGFRTVLSAPAHAPYDRFVPAPGHGLGFNDLKTIECRELLLAIEGTPARVIDFEAGLAIERIVAAMATSAREGRWVMTG